MSTETELRHTVTLTEDERWLIADLLHKEWGECDTARRPYNAVTNEGLLLRQDRIDALLRKLGYLG